VYALLLLPICGGLVIAALVRLRCVTLRQGAILATVLATVMAAHAWALFRRPAGTTLWEVVLFWSAATVLILAVTPADRWGIALRRVFVGAAAVVTLASALTNLPRLVPVRVLQESTVKVWAAHAFLHGQPGDKIVLIPDNRYATGSVEEALKKGISDFPTWDITEGQTVLNEIAPRLTFRQELESLNSTATIMWIDIPGEASLIDRFPALAIREQHANGHCRRWDVETWPWWPRRIVVCPPAAS
jgi:hypothetical protein